MHLTCAALTIALAASTASALPMCKADSDCANPRDLNPDNLEAAAGANDDQSTHGSTQARIESGFHSTDMEENLATNQHAQRNIMKNSGSQGVPNMNSSGIKTDANSVLNGSGQQSDGLIQVSKTPESQFTGQGSSPPPGYNRMSSILQSTSKYQHNNGANSQTNAGNMGHSQNQMSPTHKPTGAKGVNHAKLSNKTGFILKVRELFGLFRQGQNQGQASTQQQSQEMRAEERNQQRNSQGQMLSNKINMDMNNMEHNSAMQQNHGMSKASSMPNQQGQNSMTQGQNVQQQQMNNMTPNEKQETAHPNTQQHSAEYQEISHVSEPLISRSHTEQDAEEAQLDNQQSEQQHENAEHRGVEREQQMDQGMQQEAQEMMQMDKRDHEENRYQQGLEQMDSREQMDNREQVDNREQQMNNQMNNREQMDNQANQQHQRMEQDYNGNNQEQLAQQQGMEQQQQQY